MSISMYILLVMGAIFQVAIVYILYVYLLFVYTLEVQDQTKNGLQDDPCKGFPTTNGENLFFGLPGYVLFSNSLC